MMTLSVIIVSKKDLFLQGIQFRIEESRKVTKRVMRSRPIGVGVRALPIFNRCLK